MALAETKQSVLNSETLESLESLQIEGEPDLVFEIFSIFIENAAERLASMDRLASLAQLQDLSMEAHALKSSARAIGALNLGKMCEQLEFHPEQGLGAEKLLEKLHSEMNLVIIELKKHKPALSNF